MSKLKRQLTTHQDIPFRRREEFIFFAGSKIKIVKDIFNLYAKFDFPDVHYVSESDRCQDIRDRIAGHAVMTVLEIIRIKRA